MLRGVHFLYLKQKEKHKFCIPFPLANLSVSIIHSFHCARGIWQMPHTSLLCHLDLQAMLSHSGSLYLGYMICDPQAISCHEAREKLENCMQLWCLCLWQCSLPKAPLPEDDFLLQCRAAVSCPRSDPASMQMPVSTLPSQALGEQEAASLAQAL